MTSARLREDGGFRLREAGGFRLLEVTQDFEGGYELREDGGFELREDGSYELREGTFVEAEDTVRRLGISKPRPRNGKAQGATLGIVATLFPGLATGSGIAVGAVLDAPMPRNATGKGDVLTARFAMTVSGDARGQIAYDRALIDADLLAIAGSL